MFNIFGGDSNERELKKLDPIVKRINELEPEFQKLSDEELKTKTSEFKKRLADATTKIKQEIDDTKKELAEAQSCLNIVEGLDEKAEKSVECKRLQDSIRELDKDLRKEENNFLNGLMPEAFAAVREAARRHLGQRHFDVQLMGGIVLHRGHIAEMRTGEGKTLVATLPLYLNSLTGRGVHLVTVNDYLARRDPYWMGPIFYALGVSVASIYPMQSEAERLPSLLYDPDYNSGKGNDPWRHFKPVQRKEAYAADVTYGTSAEFGFDYLRDNMSVDLSQTVQREQNFAIVDEVDNLLIDEARTPLIISGPGETPSDEYRKIALLISKLKGREIEPSERRNAYGEDSEAKNVGYDYEYEPKNQSIVLTQEGQEKLAMWLHDPLLFEDETLRNKISEIQTPDERKQAQEPIEEPLPRTHNKQRIQNALRAKEFYHKDHEYMVKDGKVLIVDQFTGRVLVGRRYSEGLHQAIEAQENVKVEAENRTYATITIQNYFRMYAKLAGMTGTAVTEAEEFSKIYKLEVIIIPTNKPLKREDLSDQIYKNEEAKFKALVNEVKEMHELGRPVLMGTVAIENSEILSEMLNRCGIKHNVLNAKKHEKEANTISQAGELRAVTIATNMAGRGVDIILGGDPWSYEPSDDILDILGKQEIDSARKSLGKDVVKEGYPPEIFAMITSLQQVENSLRQKRRESVLNSIYIENDEIKSIRNEQVSVYGKLVEEFKDWKKNIVSELKRATEIASKNNNTERASSLKIAIEKLSKTSDDYLAQIETILKKHDSDLKNWQQNHDKVVALGGLHVLGSERHEARRIDNQLRGRSGRQGDPGSSRFYVALDDELMRRFGGERIQGIMNWAGMDENTPIENRLISRSIENAQTKVEGFNFDIRKHLVDYDDVINKQREIIYGERHKILTGADLRSNILDMVNGVIEVEADKFLKVPGGEEPDFAALIGAINNIFPVPPEITPETLAQMRTDEVVDKLIQTSEELYSKKEEEVGPANMRVLERLVMLRVIDTLWVEHLTAVDYLRQGIGMEAMAQQDPLVAYKRRASGMFDELREAIRDDVAHMIYRVSIVKPGAPGQTAPQPSSPMTKIVGKSGEKNPIQPGQKPGRNEPCPCGSGKKYKRCHGANEAS